MLAKLRKVIDSFGMQKSDQDYKCLTNLSDLIGNFDQSKPSQHCLKIKKQLVNLGKMERYFNSNIYKELIRFCEEEYFSRVSVKAAAI